jgi:nicotinamidase-related amidase
MAQKTVIHPSGIRQEIVDKVVGRRGYLNAFSEVDPARTALVVIDLDEGTGRDSDEQVTTISNNINSFATTLRKHGGTIAWVTTPIQKATDNFRVVFGEELTKRYEADGKSGKSNNIWSELNSQASDIHATKSGHSTFFPGKSDLDEQLRAKGIDNLLIVGAVTNVCCEASARDAVELQYRVTMVSDALIGHSFGLHEATLATFFRCYGDVRPTDDVVTLIEAS